jgi:hypothetical protein
MALLSMTRDIAVPLPSCKTSSVGAFISRSFLVISVPRQAAHGAEVVGSVFAAAAAAVPTASVAHVGRLFVDLAFRLFAGYRPPVAARRFVQRHAGASQIASRKKEANGVDVVRLAQGLGKVFRAVRGELGRVEQFGGAVVYGLVAPTIVIGPWVVWMA